MGALTSLSFLAVVFIQYCAGADYYVIPDGGECPTDVPGTPCFSLSQYIDDYPNWFTVSNSKFYFLNGTHYLPENQPLVIRNATNLVWQGQGVTEPGFHGTVMQSSVLIKCKTPNSSIAFVYGTNITIERITIADCGMLANFSNALEDSLKLSNINDWLMYNITLTIFEVRLVQMKDFSVQNGSGYGMLVINGFDIQIARSSFAQNNLQVYRDNYQCGSCRGANAVFFFVTPFQACHEELKSYYVELASTNISLGVDAAASSSRINTGGGLTIYLEQGDSYAVEVKLDTVKSYGNTALIGANIAFIVTSLVTYYKFEMTNCVSAYANNVYKLPPSGNGSVEHSYGCGLYVLIGLPTPFYNASCKSELSPSLNRTPVYIEDSKFLDNVGGYGVGAYIELFSTLTFNELTFVNFTNVSFDGNIGEFCTALYLEAINSGLGMPTVLALDKVTVSNSLSHLNSQLPQSALCANSLYSLIIKDYVACNNSGTGLKVFDSQIIFTGDNYFFNNSGGNGGGLSIFGNTFCILQFPVLIEFISNHAATYGGGIYVDENSFLSEYCFFQTLNLRDVSELSLDNGILFMNNSAGLAGSVLYGGNIATCRLLPSTLLATVNSNIIFDAVFNYSSQTGDSVISSQATKVCFCKDGQPFCQSPTTDQLAYPGQELSLHVVTVGQRNGTTLGTVLVEEYANDTKISQTLFSESNDNTGCRQLSYLIHSPPGETSTVLYLSVYEESLAGSNVNASRINVSINIDVAPCPPGFQDSFSTSNCECSSALIDATHGNISCNGTTLEITTNGGVWVGYDQAYDCVLAYSDCPFDYCMNSAVTFLVNDSSAQCNLNRSGLLCGQCSPTLSVVLGSNNCTACTNDSLLLVIPFAVAGMLLVVLLITLNLTVSVGTINGLIFYANIVQVSRFIFFADGPIPFLSTFIAWINLDLGIETCFYDGMDGYSKMWLQFVFPIYIWIMMGALAIVARFSSKFSNILGTNVIPVLSTLLLLSCMKIYRTVIQMLAITGQGKIGCNESSSVDVWYIDPNIQYLAPGHIYMLFIALLVLVVLILPYTFILLLSPLLEGPALKYRCCQFWGKFKHFFDAYNAPYKDRYRFWTGFLLLARLVLMLVLSFSNFAIVLATLVSAIAVILTLLVSFGGVYRNRYLDILDSCFYLDLVFMAACSFTGLTYIGTSIGVTVAFFMFLAIVAFHLYRCVKQMVGYGQPSKAYEVIRRQRSFLEEPILDIEGTLANVSKKKWLPKTTTVNISQESCSIEVIRRRESLLDDEETIKDHYRIHDTD